LAHICAVLAHLSRVHAHKLTGALVVTPSGTRAEVAGCIPYRLHNVKAGVGTAGVGTSGRAVQHPYQARPAALPMLLCAPAAAAAVLYSWYHAVAAVVFSGWVVR
jgi:hypothetical protein